MISAKQSRWLIFLALVSGAAILAWAATTNYTQGFDTGHGWTYTLLTCNITNPATPCTSGDVADGNSNATGVFAKASTLQPGARTTSGYFSKSFTWEALGVPSGTTVTTVDGDWYSKRLNTGGGCTTSSTAGMQIFDSANTTEVTTTAIEPAINVSADAAFTNHNPTGAVNVSAAFQPAATTITLRFNLNPAVNGNPSTCEIRGDDFKLTIVSSAGGNSRRKPIITTYVVNMQDMMGR